MGKKFRLISKNKPLFEKFCRLNSKKYDTKNKIRYKTIHRELIYSWCQDPFDVQTLESDFEEYEGIIILDNNEKFSYRHTITSSCMRPLELEHEYILTKII